MDLLCFSSVLCLLCLCASVYMCFVVTCWERADLLALVCGVFCEFVTFPLVSWSSIGPTLGSMTSRNPNPYKGMASL